MLNKLLKRCMPWMDKGRWYHVRINGDESVIMDDIFDHVELPDNTSSPVRIYFKQGHNYVMLNAKVTLSKTPSGFNLDPFVVDGTKPVTSLQVTPSATYAIVLPMLSDVDVDYWFFLRPLER